MREMADKSTQFFFFFFLFTPFPFSWRYINKSIVIKVDELENESKRAKEDKKDRKNENTNEHRNDDVRIAF